MALSFFLIGWLAPRDPLAANAPESFYGQAQVPVPAVRLSDEPIDRETIEEILQTYAAAGVSNVLLIRGDPPLDQQPYDSSADDFAHAVDLVRYVREFNTRAEHPDQRGFGVVVAGFPEGHAETPNRLKQLDHLKAKVDAGADAIISQMFFSNAAFFDWCERCDLAGVKTPKDRARSPESKFKQSLSLWTPWNRSWN